MARRIGRLTRSILLMALLVVAAIAFLTRELGLDVAELMDFLGTIVLLILGLVVLAAVAGALIRLMRR